MKDVLRTISENFINKIWTYQIYTLEISGKFLLDAGLWSPFQEKMQNLYIGNKMIWDDMLYNYSAQKILGTLF